MNSAELTARLTLRATPGLTDRALNELIARHGCAVDAMVSSREIIAAGAKALPDAAVRSRVNSAMRIIDRLGVRVIGSDSKDYPSRLKQRREMRCPALLFALGNTQLLDDVGIAVVGSRRMSEYGRSIAEDFSRDLTNAGLTVISGLALGIDAVAHTAALDADGDTIAVVGNGIDVIYPRANARLRARIIERGLLISQFLPGEKPARYNFPERNITMAVLAEGVLVVEAGAVSGAIITANQAAEYNVDAMAVPGPIRRDSSAGSNQLIREGAVCVTNVAEILETMDRGERMQELAQQLLRRMQRRALPADMSDDAPDTIGSNAARRADTRTPRESPDANAVRTAIGNDVLHMDEIAASTGLPISTVMSTLLEMELGGVVRQHPGTRFEVRK